MKDSIRGEFRDDGSFVGFDYETQSWIDTSFEAVRDPTFRLGSASNPLAQVPTNGA